MHIGSAIALWLRDLSLCIGALKEIDDNVVYWYDLYISSHDPHERRTR